MNRFEIRDILKEHKEHYRVLPTNAMNAILGIIETIEREAVREVIDIEITSLKAREEKSVVLGKRTRKDKKKSARSKR